MAGRLSGRLGRDVGDGFHRNPHPLDLFDGQRLGATFCGDQVDREGSTGGERLDRIETRMVGLREGLSCGVRLHERSVRRANLCAGRAGRHPGRGRHGVPHEIL